MTQFRKTGDKGRYDFREPACISATCWQPGRYDVRGASSGGSRSTGAFRLSCLRRDHFGCPETVAREPGLATLRRKDGWRLA